MKLKFCFTYFKLCSCQKEQIASPAGGLICETWHSSLCQSSQYFTMPALHSLDSGTCGAYILLVKHVAKLKAVVFGETSSAPGDTASKVGTLTVG